MYVGTWVVFPNKRFNVQFAALGRMCSGMTWRGPFFLRKPSVCADVGIQRSLMFANLAKLNVSESCPKSIDIVFT